MDHIPNHVFGLLPKMQEKENPNKKEPVSVIPGVGPFLYFSNGSMPIPVSSLSQVTIQGIEGKKKTYSGTGVAEW